MKPQSLTLVVLAAVLVIGISPTLVQAQTFVDLDSVPIDRTVLPLQAPYNKPITAARRS